MTPHPNETPEPLAGSTIQQHLTVADLPRHPEPHTHTWTEMEKRCILAWGAELVAHKAEALAHEQAGEMPAVAYLVTNLSSGEPSLCFEDERGDYGDEDHMPVFEELCRRSEFTAALQAKDAEIAGLKADAGRYRWLLANKSLIRKVVMELGYGFGAALQGAEYVNEVLDEARELGKDAWGVPLVGAAAIRAQTGGAG